MTVAADNSVADGVRVTFSREEVRLSLSPLECEEDAGGRVEEAVEELEAGAEGEEDALSLLSLSLLLFGSRDDVGEEEGEVVVDDLEDTEDEEEGEEKDDVRSLALCGEGGLRLEGGDGVVREEVAGCCKGNQY